MSLAARVNPHRRTVCCYCVLPSRGQSALPFHPSIDDFSDVSNISLVERVFLIGARRRMDSISMQREHTVFVSGEEKGDTRASVRQ